jgi:Glycosyltransferase family 87
MLTDSGKSGRWRFTRREWVGLAAGICLFIAYGVNLEGRTALRRVPMTDLGCFTIASEAIWSGENPYAVSDWHGWHYNYPPMLAILFLPLAEPIPKGLPVLQPGEQYTEANTPWGYRISAQKPGSFKYGLHDQNRHFFWMIGVWYGLSVSFIFLSAHALACALEGRRLKSPPPESKAERSRWWKLRLLPLLVCVGLFGTDLSRGQVDSLMLLAISLGLYLAASGCNFKAGLFLAFPAAIKLIPPFLLVYPFWRRQWRLAAGVVAGLVAFYLLLPGITMGPARTIELYQTWVQVLAKPALGHGTDNSRINELTGIDSTDNQSLLAAVHNWRYHSLPRSERPPNASPSERRLVYFIGAAFLAAVGFMLGIRRSDTRGELLVIGGLLLGLTFLISPVIHNYYYLLMLPLIAALLDQGLLPQSGRAKQWRLILPVVVFMLVESMAQMPVVGPFIKDAGMSLLGLMYLMWGGVIMISSTSGITEQMKLGKLASPESRKQRFCSEK